MYFCKSLQSPSWKIRDYKEPAASKISCCQV